MLAADAEVSQLIGAYDRAAASLRAALRIYQDTRAVPLAEQARAALASLTTEPRANPAYRSARASTGFQPPFNPPR